jgi:hypothetical protein
MRLAYRSCLQYGTAAAPVLAASRPAHIQTGPQPEKAETCVRSELGSIMEEMPSPRPPYLARAARRLPCVRSIGRTLSRIGTNVEKVKLR